MITYRLRRSLLDRVLGGICGGIGSYLNLSAWWLRIAFIAIALTSLNFGVLLYVLLWVLIPGQEITDVPPIILPGQNQPRRYGKA
jgi:phage shock protein C